MDINSNINGILIVNKPSGYTSRDIVNIVSKKLNTKKIGHTGTLDPMAKGVLVLTIGKCTKLSEFLTNKYKTYVAEFTLGYETDTLDSTGTIVKSNSKKVDKTLIEKVILSFKGEYLQEVPKYSAVKVDGKRLYNQARNGVEVELPKRIVDIRDIKIISIDEDKIKIECSVSKGTYIRSLIRDIGEKLGTYATMTDLVRTKQDNYSTNESYTLEDIENGNFRILGINEVLSDVESIEVDDELYKNVFNGCKLKLDKQGEFIKFERDKEIIALYKKDNDFYRMYIKF